MADLNVAFGAQSANPFSVQIEQAGFASQGSWPDAADPGDRQLGLVLPQQFGIALVHSFTDGIAERRDDGAAWA